jgi:NAD(P)-dependent dehydrogenase (short-subunit alcohol dehydrogenase family)
MRGRTKAGKCPHCTDVNLRYRYLVINAFASPIKACVFGASGGIGAAFVKQLAADPMVAVVHAGGRTEPASGAKVLPFRFDLRDEASIAEAAANIGSLDLIIIATGLLHDGAFQPEKSYRAQSADAYARAFAINATGPALIAKHFLPQLPRNSRSIFCAISARVSSISDNRLGGWHAYRASKAALNMIMRNIAIELGRSHPQAVVATLHPGTVDTPLSEPFQRNVADGKLFTPDHSAESMLKVIDGLTPEDSGNLFAWDGQRIDY